MVEECVESKFEKITDTKVENLEDVKRHDFASSELMQLNYEAMVHSGGKVKRLGQKK